MPLVLVPRVDADAATWGKCRHHDAPWGAGRDRCRIAIAVPWGPR